MVRKICSVIVDDEWQVGGFDLGESKMDGNLVSDDLGDWPSYWYDMIVS